MIATSNNIRCAAGGADHDNRGLERLNKNPGMQKLLERFRPMAHGVFFRRFYFGKGLLHAVGDKDGIIAEAVVAARREGEMAMHLTLEHTRFP